MPFDLLAAARDLVAADTVSGRGNLAIVPVVTGLAAQVGLPLEVLPETIAGIRHANLLVRLPGAPDREPLLLVTHTDTVDAGPTERWTATAPWTLRADGDHLYGLGSADVKLDVAAKLLALERVKGRPLARGVAFLGTFGEEIGLLGAKAFVRSGRLRPRAAVCGEPSDLHIVHAHKGYVVARVTLGANRGATAAARAVRFEGKAAHSATPALGVNAVEKALASPLDGAVFLRGGQGANSVPAFCEVGFGPEEAEGRSIGDAETDAGGRSSAAASSRLPLDAIRRCATRWHALVAALAPPSDPRFSPSEAVSNLGFLDASSTGAEMLLDARLLPGHDPRALARAYEEEVHALGGTVSFERENPAVWTDPGGTLVSAACGVSRTLGLPDAPETKATNTEAAAFAGLCDAIVFGAGHSQGNAHCPNERTSLSQLLRAADWYERLILELCA